MQAILAASILLAALPLAAQDPAVFHADTSLALVRFQVVHNNSYVLNLKPEDVQLLEDGKPRPFTVFENGRSTNRTTPVDLALLFDISGSVLDAGLLNPLVFKTTILDGLPNVRLAVYGFSDDLRRYARPTRDMAAVEAAFHSLGERSRGETITLQPPPKRSANRPGTWIYEAVIAAARDLSPSPADNAMILIFSDGLANNSSSVPEDAAAVAQELGVTVYPAVLGFKNLQEKIAQAKQAAGNNTSLRLTNLDAQQNEVRRYTLLGQLTGGRAFDLPQISLAVLQQILEFMVGQIRHQYLVGFVPEPSQKPRTHKLQVRLVDKSQGTLLGGTRTLIH